jgi:hypothetical protein
MRRWLPALLTLFAATPSHAQTPGSVDFQRDIRPILSNQCFKCHGPALQESGIRLDSREAATKRKIVVPGKPEASRLIERVLASDDERISCRCRRRLMPLCRTRARTPMRSSSIACSRRRIMANGKRGTGSI